MMFLLFLIYKDATRFFNQVAIELSADQDKDAGRDGKDCQDDAQTTQSWDQSEEAIGDEKDGQQKHAEVLGDSHGNTPLLCE